jgi:GDPmannose 4,6-dehydratase
MRALITGVTGQDGAYLTALLLAEGYDVVGTSPRRSSDGANLQRLYDVGAFDNHKFTYEMLDVTCSSSVESMLSSRQFDAVYNLAAQSFVKESFASPIATTTINYIGALNILESIKRHSRDTRFYQASTSEMFGLVSCESQNEDTPFHPRSPYAVAKAAAHYAVQNYREAYGMYACSGILFNHESPHRGIEFVTRKITDGVAQIVCGKRMDITLGNIDAKRDWGSARDYVNAMYLMMTQSRPKDYVIATGVAHSVREVLEVAFGRVNLDWKNYVHQDSRFLRPSDVPILCGDATRAQEELGWRTTTNFRTMIEEMVDYDLQRYNVDPLKLMLNGG